MEIKLTFNGKTVKQHFIKWYCKKCYVAMTKGNRSYSWLWLIKPDWRHYYFWTVDEGNHDSRFFNHKHVQHKRKGNFFQDRIDLFKTNGFKYKISKP